MISDLRVLAWLHWKRFKSSAAYWLSLIGFEPGANRFYLVYVTIFWLFWLYTMWAFVVDQAYHISQVIPAASVATLREGVPMLIFALQVLYLINVLRDSPLKLSAAEIEHVAASPADRGTMVLIAFVRNALVLAALAGIAGSLVAMLLTWQTAPALAGIAGLQGLVIGVPLCLFSMAVGWIVAILKQPIRARLTRWAMWLAIPAVVALAALLPQVMLAPGNLWQMALDAHMTAGSMAGTAALLVAGLIALVLAGKRVNMAAAADDSRMYARIQKLGIFAHLYADDVIASVRRQSKLLRKRHLRLAMEEQATGYRVMLNRALLSLFRLAPSSMFRLVMRGVALAGIVSLIARIGGGEQLQTWVLLLIIVIQMRPTELNAAFQQDTGQAFTRQFLPRNPLRMALADAALPIALFSFGGLVTLLAQPWIDPVTAVVLVISVALALTWCQALELVSAPPLVFRRIPYTYSALAGGVVLIAAGYALRSATGVALAAVIVNLALAGMLHFSRV